MTNTISTTTNAPSSEPFESIDYTTFETTYQPIPAPSGSDLWQWSELDGIPTNRIWTAVEDEITSAIPGVHHVNRIGYLVSTVPWPHENLDVDLTDPDAPVDDEEDEEEAAPPAR